MECVICGGSANTVTENRVGRYRGERVQIKSEFFRCEECGETFFNPNQMKIHTRSVKNEIRKKYGLLPPEKIAEIRKRLELTQDELEQLLGTGPKVVVRWENGKVIQSRGHDNMLRLLDRDPSVIEELRQIQRLRDTEQRKYRQSDEPDPKRMIARAV